MWKMINPDFLNPIKISKRVETGDEAYSRVNKSRLNSVSYDALHVERSNLKDTRVWWFDSPTRFTR